MYNFTKLACILRLFLYKAIPFVIDTVFVIALVLYIEGLLFFPPSSPITGIALMLFLLVLIGSLYLLFLQLYFNNEIKFNRNYVINKDEEIKG